MTDTANLSLPNIIAGQAQKEVTHNEGLQILDAIVQLSVLGFSDTPPGAPEQGERYVVDASPTGAWAGKEGYIAAYYGAGWVFFAPITGWSLVDMNDGSMYLYVGDVGDTPVVTDWILRLGVAGSGWSDTTGTVSRTALNTGTATTSDVAQHLAALITDLKASGLISD